MPIISQVYSCLPPTIFVLILFSQGTHLVIFRSTRCITPKAKSLHGPILQSLKLNDIFFLYGTHPILPARSVLILPSLISTVSAFASLAMILLFSRLTWTTVLSKDGRTPPTDNAIERFLKAGALGRITMSSMFLPGWMRTRTCTVARELSYISCCCGLLMYHFPPRSNQGTIFRAWQGWTSMSTTSPGEGTLRVVPMLRLSIAYIMLRPFFRQKDGSDEWEVDLEGTSFPGAHLGGKQFLSKGTHPHLQLDKTLVGIPTVEPGDQVYCSCFPLLNTSRCFKCTHLNRSTRAL